MSRRLYFCEPGWEAVLLDELGRGFPTSQHRLLMPAWVESQLSPADDSLVPCVAFAAQCLANADDVSAASISAWGRQAADWLMERLRTHEGPWRLHVFSEQVEGGVSTGRCRLIAEAITEVLRKKQRRLVRSQIADEKSPWSPGEALMQIALTSPASGFFSHASPEDLQRLRRCVCHFPAGVVDVPADRAAPSRAFCKLVEVEMRLGRPIGSGETCVDLGSSPGSWAYVALARGAKVVAIDRSPLRDDLMSHPNLTFHRGDAFQYEPPVPIDWLLCDVIAFPLRSLELLQQWITRRWCRFFCVTIKFRGQDDYPLLEEIKTWLVASGVDFELRRLTHNKNEVTAFGQCGGEVGRPATTRFSERHST
jgi:23S rRNA (cytidine2498-2'-O)-methyltransferase